MTIDPATHPPVPKGDLEHAVILRAQKERRYVQARRAYWSAFSNKGQLDAVAEAFEAMRFADQELRRARAHLEDLLHDAARGGLGA